MSTRSLVFTAERLLQVLSTFPEVNSYIVGLSGGADSTALVHALCKVRERLRVPFSAVHVNHGIHAESNLWQRQCEQFCRGQGVELTCLQIELKHASGKGLEAEARQLRYEAMSSLLGPADCLLTAHHADDQAETLLLNLMRGSGVDGLTAMPESRPLGDGYLQRPLLRFKNSVLKDYLHRHEIEWIEDPSNQYLNHDRNFVRHELIPLMEKRWPEVNQRLLLTQDAMTDARHLLERLADEYLEPNLYHPFVLHITPKCITEPQLFRLVVRRWMRQSGVPVIPAYKLGTFVDQVKRADSDHKISVSWDRCLLRWYKDRLWLQTDSEIMPCPAVRWPGGQTELDLGEDVGLMSIKAMEPTQRQLSPVIDMFTGSRFRVDSRVNIRDAVISQGSHHKSLKKLFQANEIPPWLRNSIPICLLDDEIVALGDWCFDEQFANWLSDHGIGLYWRPRHPILMYMHKQKQKVNH